MVKVMRAKRVAALSKVLPAALQQRVRLSLCSWLCRLECYRVLALSH